MKLILTTALLLLIFSQSFLYSQTFSTPSSVLKEMELRSFERDGKTFSYKVVYPYDYDENKKYPVYLALSGGLAFERIVDYCYYVMFKSNIVKSNYITVLPVSFHERSLKDFTDQEIKQLIGIIKNLESVTDSNWVLSGTSYGGIAVFNFAKLMPELFNGFITMPGSMPFDEVPAEWKDYRVMLAIGDKESEEWEYKVKQTAKKLEGKVKTLIKFRLENQPHVVMPNYNIDPLYRKYFNY